MSDAEPPDQSLDSFRRAAAERPDDVVALGDCARALAADIWKRWGAVPPHQAEEPLIALRELGDVLRRLARLDGASAPFLVGTLELLGKLHCWRREFDAARTVFDENLEICRLAVETGGDDVANRTELAETLDELAFVAEETDDLVGARTLRDESLSIRRALAAEDADSREAFAEALGKYAKLADKDGRPHRAVECRDECVSILRALVDEEPDEDLYTSDLASALEDRAHVRFESGDADGARTDAEEAAAIYRAEIAAQPQDAWEIEGVLELLVDLAHARKDWAECLRASEEWATIIRRVQEREDEGLAGDLGRALRLIADMHWNLDDFAKARGAYEEALAYHRERAVADPDDAELAGHVADLLDALAGTHDKLGDAAQARRIYAELHETYVVARRIHPEDADLARAQRWGLERSARFHTRTEDLDTALTLRIEQVGIARALALSTPTTDSRDDVRFDLIDLGDLHVRRSEWPRAAAAYREAVSIARALAVENPEDGDWLVSIAFPLAELRDVLVASGEKGEAVVAAREVVSLQRAVVAAEPSNLEMLREFLVDLDELGDCLRAIGDDVAADDAYAEAESIARGLVARDTSIARWHDDVFAVLGRRARLALDRGDATAAVAGFAASAEEARVLVAQAPDVVKWRRKLGGRLADLGEARTATGDHEGALAAYEEAVPLLAATRGDEDGANADSLRETLNDAADAASAAGRPDLAILFRARLVDIP